jgi:hypothetical protein
LPSSVRFLGLQGSSPSIVDACPVADITCIAIAASFVYLAAILDAWSRRVIGLPNEQLRTMVKER